MPFIKAAKQIEGHVGRVYSNCTYAPDGSNWAAQVDEVQAGETEITAQEHAAILAANVQALAQAAQADPDLSNEQKAATLTSLADTALLSVDVAAELTAAAVIADKG